MSQPHEPILSPPARPPVQGLIATLPVATDPTLRSGWAFQPEGCAGGGLVSIDCTGSVASRSTSFGPDQVDGDPVMVYAFDKCSSFGFAARDWQGRARRSLAATRSFQLAKELWSGAVASADSLDNRYLAGSGLWSDTVTSGPTDVVTALADVESALGTCGAGRQGLIHVTTQAIVKMAAANVITRSGSTWVSTNGHLVIADAGYDGSGPGGVAASSSQWIYGTSMMRIREGPVEVRPESMDDARSLAEALNHSTNTVIVWAQQAMALEWDWCCHIAAEISLPVALIGGAS